jgi:hypothetical protein
VASGIGIAAQLPYIKELLRKRREASVRTQTVTLIWKLDRTEDWECARDWLQELVTEDNGYVYKIPMSLSGYVVAYSPEDVESIGLRPTAPLEGHLERWRA